jgi:CubicO group peptidase (beta-lactamase class C family)
MIHPRRPFSYFLMPLLLAGAASAGRAALSPAQTAAVDSAVKTEMVRQRLVGAAVGVVQDGRIVYTQGYGWQDREKRIPASRNTMFRWASISKPVTAVAAMQLVDKGRLNLDADVRSYVPEFPDKGKPITVAQTLSHQSGLPFYTNGKVIPRDRKYDTPHPFADVVTAVDTFALSPLLFDPGTKYSYTTYGYILASAVVQRAGNEPFAQQVKERIAVPLGMTTFQPDYQWKDIANRAVGYRKHGDEIVPSSNTDVSWKLGGGGYISDIGDLARFAQGLLNHKLVSRAAERLMWTPRATSGGTKTDYGLGFDVRLDGAGRRTVSHGGSQEKTRSLMWLRPEERRAIVVFSNSEYADVSRLKDAVAAALDSGSS